MKIVCAAAVVALAALALNCGDDAKPPPQTPDQTTINNPQPTNPAAGDGDASSPAK